MSEEVIDIIQLSRAFGVGPVIYKKLIAKFGSARDALNEVRKNPFIAGREIKLISRQDAEKEYRDGQNIQAICITQENAFYPTPLLETDNAPIFFWLKGDVHILQKTSCAIVGSRNASVGGRKIAYSLAQNITKKGFVTISGLARGIDAAAHKGSLESGTIAVLASGVDHIYPPEHKDLYHDILAHGGAIISENPPGAQPKANLFPKRNRIISGLAKAVVIVEGGLRSGSLSTAYYALNQNRELFAVPGSPLDPRAAGPNKLLKSGASWAESSEDVLNYLEDINANGHKALSQQIKEKVCDNIKPDLTDEEDMAAYTIAENAKKAYQDEQDFLSYFGTVPISEDEIIRLSGRAPADILCELSEHEILGNIERLAGNMFLKIPMKI
ncbi:MAG: DNA-processing protein DprA [Pseudomonadota bacterium]